MNWPAGSQVGQGRPRPTPRLVHLWIALGVGAVFGSALFVVLAPLARAIGLGVVMAAVSFVLLRAMEVGTVEWPAPPPDPARRVDRAQRWRLNGFDAMVDKSPGFSSHLRSRLRVLASAILARRELVPGTPGAVLLLGQGTHDLLFPDLSKPLERDPGRSAPDDPSAAELSAMTDRLIELSATPTKGPR